MSDSNVSLIWITPDPERVVAYCARVSSDYRDNPEYAKLFKYLIQHSLDDLSEDVKAAWRKRQENLYSAAQRDYFWALEHGIAKECARAVLPLATETTLIMQGTLRSWMHYLDVRTDPSTQKEHRDVALKIREELKPQLPIIAEILEW